jgi:hypothetical protein
VAKPETAAPKAETRAAATSDFAGDLESGLRAAGLSFSADAVAQSEVSVGGSEVLIRCAPALMMALRDASVQRTATQILKRPVKIRLEAGQTNKAAPIVAAPERTPTEDAFRERALSDPSVKRFQELFPDAQIRTVRNLNE